MKVKTDKIFNIVSTFKAADAEDGGVRIRGMASTSDVDRAGDVITPEAWTRGGLTNYKNNPILLFNHNYHKPIGRATDIKPTANGLEIEGKISKAAPDNVAELIKDGVLGAFSVGFLVKDADYDEKTDGFKIKDAELFEVSVVSVPMNQAATFSLAKSFDSKEEYEDFKKTFTNRVDLASQSLAKEEVTASNIARNTLDGTSSDGQKEIKMSGENRTPELNADAIAKKVAQEVAANEAMRQAKKDAEAAQIAEAEKKAAEAKAAVKAEIDAAVKAGLSGAEKLVADLREELTAKDANMEDTLNKYKQELEEKANEIARIRESKRIFSDRGNAPKSVIEANGKELMYAHMLGVMTRKGWDTNYAKNLMEKAGIDYVTNAPDIDQEVSQQIEKEITVETKVAPLFRQFPVNGAATVLPIQPDTGLADWAINATAGNLENRGASNNTYQPKQVILNAYRLVSSTYMDNDVDEQVLVNLMPMLVEGVARAHARTVDRTILIGDGASSPNIGGLTSYAAAHSEQIDLDATSVGTNSAVMTSAILLNARKGMGKYGIKPEELVYIVSQNSYFDLLSDSSFQTLDEVGPMAIRLTGSVGAVYGTPVVVSDEFATESAGNAAAFVVYRRNYVIPRLRGIKVEQDYEVMNQRRVIVASQALGFEELLAGDGSGTEPSMKITFTA